MALGVLGCVCARLVEGVIVIECGGGGCVCGGCVCVCVCVGMFNHNCQGRSKNFCKPAILKVQDPFKRSIKSKPFSKY